MSKDLYLAAVDPRVDLKDDRVIRIINDGPSSSTYNAFPATNSSSTVNTVYQVNPPSTRTGLGRYLRHRIVGSAVITGTNFANVNAGQATNRQIQVALRPWPLASCMSSVQVQINNANISVGQPNQYMPAFGRVANPIVNQVGFQSGSAPAPDIYNSYVDATQTVSSPFNLSTEIPDGYISRPRTEQITGFYIQDAQHAIVSFDITEALVIPPFVSETNQVEALYGVNQLTITINWANIWKMFSIALTSAPGAAGPATISDCTVTFAKQTLLLNYVSKYTDSMTTHMPAQVYNCPQLQLYTTAVNEGPSKSTAGSNGAGIVWKTASNIATGTVTVPICPRLAIVWVSDQNTVAFAAPTPTSTGAIAVPDRIYPIQGIQVNAYDKASLLSGADVNQLYEMSVAAGLNATSAQFQGLPCVLQSALAQNTSFAAVHNACPVVIDFANLSLPPGVAPGVNLQSQIQFQVTFANNLFDTIYNGAGADLAGVNINVLLVTPGYLVNSENGGSELVTGGVTPNEALQAKHSSSGQYNAIMHQQTATTIMGGSFWDTLKNIGRSVLSVAAPLVSSVAPELAPMVGMAQSLAGSGKLTKHHAKKAHDRGYY